MTDKKLHTEADRANARDLFAPAFWRSFAALSLVLSVSSFMNVSVFPFFDGVFTYARDISITANAAVLIAIGLLATFRPALLHVRALNAGALVLMAAGCALPLALGLGSASLLVLTSCALAVGRAWCVLTAGIAASRLSSAQAGVLVPLAFVVQGATSAFAWLLPVWVGMAIFLAAPFAAWALSWRDARPVLEQTQAGEAPHDFLRYAPVVVLAAGKPVVRVPVPVPRGVRLLVALRRGGRRAVVLVFRDPARGDGGRLGAAVREAFPRRFARAGVGAAHRGGLLGHDHGPAALEHRNGAAAVHGQHAVRHGCMGGAYRGGGAQQPRRGGSVRVGPRRFEPGVYAGCDAGRARECAGRHGHAAVRSVRRGVNLAVRRLCAHRAEAVQLPRGHRWRDAGRDGGGRGAEGHIRRALPGAGKPVQPDPARARGVPNARARPRPRLHPGAAGGIAQHGESPRQAYIREAGHPLAPRPDRPGGEGVGRCSPKGEGDARMKLVGLISDTHGRLPDAALGAFAYCNHIIHAGDICDPGILRELQIMAPTTAVLGNNDYDEYGKNVTRFAHPVIDGVRFLVAHYPNDARIGFNGSRAIAPGDPLPQVCVHGHTHIPEILTGRDAYPASLFICPGSCSRPRGGLPASVGFIELEAGRVRAARVESLDGEVLLEMGA